MLVSHELTQTGAPLLLLETAIAMANSGARVILTNLGYEDSILRVPTVQNLEVVSVGQSFAEAPNADLIIANTAVSKDWVSEMLTRYRNTAAKLICWIHEMQTEVYGGGVECLSQVEAVIFDSNASRRLWKQTGLQMPRISKVIHPCAADHFVREAEGITSIIRGSDDPSRHAKQGARRDNIREQLHVSRDDFLLSLFGSYCIRKGHDLLAETTNEILRSAPNLPLKLLLIGFGDPKSRQVFLNCMSTLAPLAIRDERVLPVVADLKPYYLASDAFVMNTQDDGEAFGRVTIEAMAFRLPVLGTDCGGTREIVVDGKTGLLHPAGRTEQSVLIRNILRLMNNRQEGLALGETGFKRVLSNFTEARFFKELAETIDVVMRQRNPFWFWRRRASIAQRPTG